MENLKEIQADSARISEAEERLLRVLKNQKQTFTDNGSKARDIVRKAMDTAIKSIDKHLPKLAQHLRSSIQKGYSPIYNPKKSTDWK